ncbi:MAG TPA: hypothetical protein DDW50_13785 [Firmicutes bacterium]|jgi:hypothetical protein|nr:hypothetical protein [Bacillota bacterium]
MKVVNSPEVNFGSGDFSISLWINTSSTKTNNTFIDKRDSTGKGYYCCLYNGQPLIQLNDSTSSFNYQGGPLINDNKWHYLIFSVDRDNTSGLNCYVDGILVYTASPTKTSHDLTNTVDLFIGKHTTLTNCSFVGTLDEIALYKQSLTASEVAELYNRNMNGLR